MKREAKMILVLSDARGQYIPRDFAQTIVRDTISGIDMADLDTLAEENSNEREDYWDIWQDICDRAIITDPTDGTVYTLYQDGDLWLVEQDAWLNERGCDEYDESIGAMFGFGEDEVQS